MSQFTGGISLPYIISGAGGGTLHNQALVVIDIVLAQGVEEIQNDAPGSPVEGTGYIIGTPTLGDVWDGNDGNVAVYLNSNWLFLTIATGTRVYCKATNTTMIKTATGWGYGGQGEAIWYGYLSTLFTHGSTTWTRVDNWTELQNVGTDDRLYEQQPAGAGTQGQVEVQTGGMFHLTFSGTAYATTATADPFEVGIGHGSATPENGSIRRIDFSGLGLNVEVPFHTELIYPAGALDDFFVSTRRVSGASGSINFLADACSWSIRCVRQS